MVVVVVLGAVGGGGDHVDEEVLGFKVSVEDSVLVAVGDAPQQLEQNAPRHVLVAGRACGGGQGRVSSERETRALGDTATHFLACSKRLHISMYTPRRMW